MSIKMFFLVKNLESFYWFVEISKNLLVRKRYIMSTYVSPSYIINYYYIH